ncbi:MAG: cysteine desulfurase [Bacilli bacterium]|nr:cysteine desulfurase [Bacilli bacterium]
MIYLDYAANTPTDELVLEEYVKTTKKYFANPNSRHPLGVIAKEKIDEASTSIAKYFNAGKESIIYTSGSSESNNLVIKGIAEFNKNKGNKIIISAVEHSSVVAPCNYLATLGFDVSVIPLNKDGVVDLNILKEEINDNTVLVSICSVDSELGTIEPIEDIAKIVKEYPNCVFHTDATGAIGKVDINYDNVDFITFAPHKFYGINGMGVLVNRNNKKLIPLIHGGKSTTIYRSGTPVVANATSTSLALNIAINNLEKRKEYIKRLNDKLRTELSKLNCIHINSPKSSIPNTLNISLIDRNTKDIMKELEKKDIYLSTTTACSMEGMPSKSVMAITNDINLASNSIRISLSHLTTEEEIDKFLTIFKEIL